MARRSKFGRFQVWNQSSDSWKHTDEAYNIDTLDLMIGGPNQSPTFGVGNDFNNPTTSAPTGVSQWLHPQDTTIIANLGNRTLYNIVRALDHNDVPLGSVFAWWRPSIAVPLPSGAVPADGSSYTGATQHSYGAWGITTITVPDMRNKMILGAYETDTASPTVSLNRDGVAATIPSVDTATAGPGIGAVGGTNVPRNLAHVHPVGTYVVSSHQHGLTDHQHFIGAHYHWMEHYHNYTMVDHAHVFSTTTGAVIPGNNNGAASGGALTLPNTNHNHALSGLTAGINGGAPTTGTSATIPVGGNPMLGSGYSGGSVDGTLGATGKSEGLIGSYLTGAATPTLSGSSGSALTTVEIQPRYVGLLYLVKILKAGPLHNTTFPTGP